MANQKVVDMKRLTSRILMLGLIVTVLFGCKKVEVVKFDMTYERTIIIPNGTDISVPHITVMSGNLSNSESEFEANKTNKEEIEDISLTSLNMEIISPTGEEFDFIEDVELYISADGVDEMLLAYVYNMQNIVGNTISLTCAQSDFQEFIKQDKFTLRVKTISDEFNSSDVEIKISSTFLVEATVSK